MIYARRGSLYLAGLLFVCADPALAQQALGVTTAARQQRMEHGLLPAVRLMNRPTIVWSLTERMRNYHVPGVSIAVIDGGEISWAKGYGVRAQGKTAPVTTETRFQAGSASPVGLLTALHCVRQGDLPLDTDIAPLLKTWKLPANEVTERRKVTLRTLLTHSAELTPIGTQGYAPDGKIPTPLEVLDGTLPAFNRPIDVNTVPGLKANPWEASSDLMMIQRVLEDVTGKPYAEIAQQAVLAPFAILHSGYADPDRNDRDLDIATGHVDVEPLSQRWHCYPANLEQQLWTTPTDLASLLREILQAVSGKSERLLTQELARQIMTTQIPDQGLGFEVRGSGKNLRLLLRGGSDGYYTALVLYPERGQGAVIMTNGERSDLLTEEILRGLAAEYDWPEARLPPRTAVPFAPHTLASYAGWYGLQNMTGHTAGLVCMRQEGERLFAHITGDAAGFHPAQDVELFPISRDCFCYQEEEAIFTFQRDRAGNVHGLTYRKADSTTYFPRRKTSPFLSIPPSVDPNPARTERFYKVIVALERDPQSSQDFTTDSKAHINVLTPLGIADLQPTEFIFVHGERMPPGSILTEGVTYCVRKIGKTCYYRFCMQGSAIYSIVEVYPVW